jgi:PKHD-type hydroxylase
MPVKVLALHASSPYVRCVTEADTLDQKAWHRRSVQPFAVWNKGFTSEELDAIIATGENLTHQDATIEEDGRLSVADHVRVTRTAWMAHNPETNWIYEKLWRIGYHLNQAIYRLDLSGISEQLQYTIYESTEGGHYDWHVDHSTMTPSPRKLSLSLQLSDPSEYEGCALELRAANNIDTAPMERGTVIAFPSYVLHRVTPILKGTRRSLVSWISGPLLR